MSSLPSASAAFRPALAPATPSAMVATNPVSQLLKSLNVDPVASTALLERLQRRMDERAAEADAPLDEVRTRIATLEAKLLGLSHDLQQRRRTLPGWLAQRHEERSRSAVDGMIAEAAALAAADAKESTTAAAAGQLAHATPAALPIGAVLGAAIAAGKSNTEIQQVLSEAEQLVATLRDVHASTARPTSTDLAIAFQNKENAGVVGLLRRRLATTAAEDCESASKAQRF